MKSKDDIDLQAARDFLIQKAAKRQKALDKLFRRATEDCARIIRHITRHYSPQRIWQWGSLLDRAKFREYSDIDIAIEGIDEPEKFFKMFGEVERMTNFPLDLVDINKIAPEFAAIIKRKGIVVYES